MAEFIRWWAGGCDEPASEMCIGGSTSSLPPWWILNIVKPEGPDKDMGTYRVCQFTEQQQEDFGIDAGGQILDKPKWEAAIEALRGGGSWPLPAPPSPSRRGTVGSDDGEKFVPLASDSPGWIMQRVFDAADDDKSGTIDKAEFLALLTTLGITSGVDAEADEGLLDDELYTADEDGNETLDFDEFVRWYRERGAALGRRHMRFDEAGNIVEARLVELTVTRGSSKESLRLLFDAADDDKNGTIEKAEFLALLTSLGITSGRDAEADEGLLDDELYTADEDGNDTLDADEFVRWYRESAAPLGPRRVRFDARGAIVEAAVVGPPPAPEEAPDEIDDEDIEEIDDEENSFDDE